MKKSLQLLSGIIFLLGTYANAQFIIKGGLTIHNTPINYKTTKTVAITTTAKAGFHVGGAYEIYLSDIISLQPGLQFSLRPYSFTQGDGLRNVNKLYLESPTAMKIYFLDSQSIRLYGLSGFYMGLNLSTKINGQKALLGNTTDSFQKPFDMGLVFGTGIEIDETFLISISFEPGMTNITPNGQVAQFDLQEKDRALRLSFAYKFN